MTQMYGKECHFRKKRTRKSLLKQLFHIRATPVARNRSATAIIQPLRQNISGQVNADEHHFALTWLTAFPGHANISAHQLVDTLEYDTPVHTLHLQHAFVTQQSGTVNVQYGSQKIFQFCRVKSSAAAVHKALHIVIMVMVMVMVMVVVTVMPVLTACIAFMVIMTVVVRLFTEEVGVYVQPGIEVKAAQIQHLRQRHFAEMHHLLPRARIHVCEAVLQLFQLIICYQVGFADENAVGKADLFARLLMLVELLPGMFGVHQRDDGVEQKLLRHFLIHEKRLRHRSRVSNAGSLYQHPLKVQLTRFFSLRQRLQCLAQVFAYGAADAAIAHLNNLLFGVAYQYFVVDILFAELVFYYGNFLPVRLGQHALEQSGFARAQKAGNNSGRNERSCRHLLSLKTNTTQIQKKQTPQHATHAAITAGQECDNTTKATPAEAKGLYCPGNMQRAQCGSSGLPLAGGTPARPSSAPHPVCCTVNQAANRVLQQIKQQQIKQQHMKHSNSITLTRPDDWHVHLRDGDALQAVVGHTAAQFARAIVMPNLRPPVTTTEQALAYKQRILDALVNTGTAAGKPDAANAGRQPESPPDFEPLMTLYLTDNTPPAEIATAKAAGITAAKLYPAGATTNSDSGVSRLENIYPVLEAMQQHGMLLLLHGEVTDADIDIFDREAVYIERNLTRLRRDFPQLKMVLEHITTREAAQYVAAGDDFLAATITAHHLLYNRNAIFTGGLRPHYYCLPVLKREVHRQALVEAATSGSPKFFLGTDSAPHASHLKEHAQACAGCYTADAAMELYAQAFELAGALDKLEGFASFYGADFYGLPRNTGTVTLQRSEWLSPHGYPLGNAQVKPLFAGQFHQWLLQA